MRVRFFLILSIVLLLSAFPASVAASSAQSPGGFWHRVRCGVTLWSISRMNGVSVNTIARVNRLANINCIRAGTYLWIPTTHFPPPPLPGPTTRTKVTVYWGDTLADVAWRYGVGDWRLAAVNGIHNINLIYPGQRLCTP